MRVTRRKFLQSSGGAAVMALAAAAGLFRAASAFAAWNQAAFSTRNVPDTIKALGGQAAKESKDIQITSPDIAENGAVVPISITSKLANTESIAIVIEKNPNALAANFTIPAGTEPFISTRVKMGQTSAIHALVKSDGQFYFATKEIKVTLGGCGG